MWCPEGYLTVGELLDTMCHELFDFLSTADNRAPPEPWEYPDQSFDFPSEREVKAYYNWLIASFFSAFRKDIRACVNGGNLIRLNDSMLHWTVAHKHGMRSLAALDAVLEPWAGGPFPDDYFLRMDLADMQFPYLEVNELTVAVSSTNKLVSPISGSPLCIAEAVLPTQPDRLRPWLAENAWNDPPASHTVPTAAAIVDAFKAGRTKTKRDAYNLFGKGMKTAAWFALWREAAQLEPLLAKPGPRPWNS